jgi:hypothetical protein
MVFIYFKDFKTLKVAQFGALAGQIQHMAAQKVRFTPQLLRQVALTGRFQAQLH